MCVGGRGGRMQHRSSQTKFHQAVVKFINIVAEQGPINQWKVVRQMGLTPKQYEMMKSLLIQGYSDVLEFNPSTNDFSYIGKSFINKDVTDEEDIEIEQ